MTRYELLDRIGVGGMAEIFRGKAVAAGGFEKPVAIKRILPHLSQDKRFVELLIAEAKILSLLKHRNIVQIFDVGLGDDGQYFLVMEYVDGKDIGAVQKAYETKRKRMPFDLALHVGAELCEALEHAHTAKAPDGKPMSLVHRDVSPSNVLLSRAGECKLTDFGIAKRAEQEQTGTGGVRGKFAYISPEQARNEHIEPRSDVFSVAILIWELVTGRRLFSGMADLEALRAVRDATVQRPTEIDGRLHPEVDRILIAALQRDPKRRPTAAQLGEQLRSLRYSLETSVGDPATELARIIDDAEKAARESRQIEAMPFEHIDSMGGEHTVIRIRTADAFSTKDNRGMAAARQVIDHFEEEQTRQAQLSGDQLRMLRGGARRDSSELSAPPMPRGRRETDEPTTTRPPFMSEDSSPTLGGPNPFDGDEATRLVAPTSRRTPPPERTRPKSTAPPSLPGMTAAKGKAPPPAGGLELPSTIHQRNPRLQSIGGPPPMPGGPPAMPAGMEMMPAPPTLDEEGPGTMHQRNPRSGLPEQRSRPQSVQTPPTDPRARAIPSAQPVPTPPTDIYRQPPQPEPYSRSQPSMPSQSHSQPMRPVHPTPVPQPMVQQPPQMMAPSQPLLPTPMPQPNNYPGWGAQPHRPSVPPPQLQQQYGGVPKAGGLQPWMLVVGALVMAALAFAITRAFISG